MILAYTAGRYTAATPEERDANIRAAYDLAVKLSAVGFVPVVPHPPESHADAFEAAQGYQFWITATLELMRRCDIVVCVDNWQGSSGAKGEVAEQYRLGKPVFLSVADAVAWRAVKGSEPKLYTWGVEGSRLDMDWRLDP